ncbi:MAG: FAD-binding oxidoreductase [Pseudomonadota bacterium]
MDLLTVNDPDGGYPPSWYAETAHHLEDQPVLKGAHRADVCIIGGGFTGLSAAVHLAERGYSVALLEAHRIGFGASGRNGGQIGSGQRVSVLDLEAQYGFETSKSLWDLGEAAKDTLRGLVARFDIDCALREGQILAGHRARMADPYKRMVEALVERYAYDQIDYLDVDRIQQEIASPDYHCGAMDRGAGHLHPLNFALGLARAGLKHGVRLFEHSRVERVFQGPPSRVETKTGHVIAPVVLYACNGYFGDLQTHMAARVMPINNFIAVTAPMEDARALIPSGACVADSRFVVNYFRVTEDDRLLFGGGETYGYRFPPRIDALVRPNLEAVYPQLKGVELTHAWGGTLGITRSRMPCFAKFAEGVFSAAGFSGHGVPTATFAGRVLAERVAGECERFDLFARFAPKPFPGAGALRHPILILAMTYYALLDRL